MALQQAFRALRGSARAILALPRPLLRDTALVLEAQAAEREVGLIDSAVDTVRRRPGAGSRSRAAELARELAGRLEVVRTALVRTALERLDR